MTDRVAPANRPYHHGDLRAALVEAATSVLADRGVAGFSLREAARRAGVSAAAPKHHFGDVRSLLTAVATLAFLELGNRLLAASLDDALDRGSRIRLQGVAYVGFAIENPARFDLMWQHEILDTAEPMHRAAADRAFSALDELARGPSAPPMARTDPAMAPTMSAWSMVHGFARLAIEGGFGSDPNTLECALSDLLGPVMERLRVNG